METLLFSIILTATKGLGGSFNSLFTRLGLAEWHGPFIGTLLMVLLIALFLRCLSPEETPVVTERKEKGTEYRIFLFLFFCLLAVSMVLRAKAILHTPIDTARADMLPAIRAEIRTVLDGKNPYELINNEYGMPVVHGYPPVLWMSYLPLYVLHLDLRWLNLAAQLLFYLLLLNFYLSRGRPFFKASVYSDWYFFVLVGLTLFSKQEMREVIDLHTAPYWIFTSLFFWAVLTRRKWLVLVSVPLLMLCREPGILFVLPFCVFLFFHDRKFFWQGTATTILCILAIAGPFILKDPALYFKGVFFYAHHVYENPISEMVKFYGWSGVLAKHDLLWLQKPLQLSGTAFALSYAIIKRHTLSAPASLALGGIAYLSLIMVASLTFQFLFVEVVHLAVFLAISRNARK